MTIKSDTKFLIVGLGLIGGSYCLGLRKQGYRVSAIARRKETIDYALTHGIIDEGSISADAGLIGEADIIISGLYPHTFYEWVSENQKLFKSGALLTDVTGVKGCIVYKIQELLREDVEFISAHPMAGKETVGVENADEKIFVGANYIIVPTEKNSEEAVNASRELATILNFGHISCLSPKEHDEIIGFVSQLTHCIAVSLMNVSDNDKLVNYVGDSFRDLTRIAKINENMWTELFISNKNALVNNIDRFMNELKDLRDCIDTEDADRIKQKMICSTKRRSLFDKKQE